MLDAPRSRRLALPNGLTYHVLEWGAASSIDTTVLLVHGFLDLAWTWDEVAARLASRFHVIAPDLRGHGDSDWIGPGGYYHFFDYVADLDHVASRLARSKLCVVGHSMGGSVASYWVGTRPARVDRLALIEGLGPPEISAPVPDRTARWIDAWTEARLKSPRVMASLDEAAARLRKNDPLLSAASALDLVSHGTVRVPGGFAWKHDPLHLTAGPYLYRRDVAEQFWSRIPCPTLCVDGADSRLRVPDAEAAARMAFIKDCRREVVAGAGHAVQRHQPAVLASLLDAFL
ncbi:MAG TPA: alpha/beta hydrolase [Kofleriaceae bacterium]|nr:alpha/beta hydrolase [Kofleriaceae bacterium]